MPNCQYEIWEDSDCVRSTREEDIDTPEDKAEVRRHIRYKCWLVEEIRDASSLREREVLTHLCTLIGIGCRSGFVPSIWGPQSSELYAFRVQVHNGIKKSECRSLVANTNQIIGQFFYNSHCLPRLYSLWVMGDKQGLYCFYDHHSFFSLFTHTISTFPIYSHTIDYHQYTFLP